MLRGLNVGLADRICLGTAQLGSAYGIANTMGQPTRTAATEIIRFAISQGVQWFDTAQAYGESEEVLGSAFVAVGGTDRLKVVSKLSPDFEFSSVEQLVKSVRSSLEKLHVQSLWGLLLHRPEIRGDWSAFREAIRDLKRTAMIQHFGVSTYEPDDATRFLRDSEIDILQVPSNALDRRLVDNGFCREATSASKHLFLRSVFLQGLLLMSPDQLDQVNMGWSRKYLDILWDFVRENKLDMKAFAMQAAVFHYPHAKIIVGIETIEQLRENIQVMNTLSIPSSLIAEWWSSLPKIPREVLNPALWNES